MLIALAEGPDIINQCTIVTGYHMKIKFQPHLAGSLLQPAYLQADRMLVRFVFTYTFDNIDDQAADQAWIPNDMVIQVVAPRKDHLIP